MPRARRTRAAAGKSVETLRHEEDTRTNIPTAEYQSLVREEDESPLRVAYQRRNRDLDPQLVWRGKDEQDLDDLVVNVPPLYIQEKVHPKALIADLLRQSKENREAEEHQIDMFSDFNGLPEGADRTEFYQHDGYWQNRMVLGDSLQVMASLSEREGLQGKVQCIYIDPPYGIRFNSNFQWSTTSRDVRDGNRQHITREPEQVKAFRDTWRDGIHSYLTYLRDRLTVARDLLAESGSIFVQIGDENVHRVRAVMDEVFGEDNIIATIAFKKTGAFDTNYLQSNFDHLLWFSKSRDSMKFRAIPEVKELTESDFTFYDTFEVGVFDRRPVRELLQSGRLDLSDPGELISRNPLNSAGWIDSLGFEFIFEGRNYTVPNNRHWTTTKDNLTRLGRANRLIQKGNTLRFARYWRDYSTQKLNNVWMDTAGGGFVGDPRVYVVQTDTKVIQRCIMMTTDPGDLVLDPTCGSGTTAYVAEQWGRRWITIDTSRVALALARARIMGARYPYYLLADSPEGQRKEAEISRRTPSEMPTYGNVRQGFVYERVPHITLRAIANNSQIDVIWETAQEEMEPLREKLNRALEKAWEEWEIPSEAGESWPEEIATIHALWWELRIARQKEIDASITAKADYEYLYDKPYADNSKVRVAGPFTVESISPHRVLGVDENGDVIDVIAEARNGYGTGYDFGQVILDNLRRSGVQQAHREDRITFTSLTPWPGRFVCADGRYLEDGIGEEDDAPPGPERRAAVFIGPEFGTVSRPDLVEAAREAADGGFDVLVACAFNYDAHTTEFESLGRVPVLKARMNADLHMAGELKNTGNGNLFVIFGEPDIDVLDAGNGQVQVRVNGVDVFHPNTGEVRSDGPEGIACWFIDTDYNQESFFVRHAYFLGAGDPYKSLKTTLKAEIDEDAWATLNSATSRPFPRPESGRIAVKVINHLGDEVMKVFRVG